MESGAFLSPLWKAEKAKSTLQATSVTYYAFKDRCARRTGPLVLTLRHIRRPFLALDRGL